MDYVEYIELDLQRQLEFLNISKYHELGYKGKGYTVFNAEQNNDHMLMTNKVLRDYTPDLNILNGYFTGRVSGDNLIDYGVLINNEKMTLEQAIEKYNIKIITRSMAGSTPKAILDYYKRIQKKYGVIFVCAAGNEGSDGVTGIWAKDDAAIAVGAAYLKDGKVYLMYYSGRGPEVDFVMFMARGQGTSAASPALTALIVLLLQRYGDFNQEQCVEILKSLCIDLGNPGLDESYGWGLPVLPLTDKLEILEKLRGENMAEFKDVEKDRWSKPAIDRCVNEGLLIGFEDGTFRPTEYVTREQFAIILTRILDKIK